jgi:putative CRISPR-associated protein (TIGR02620 family)
MKSVVVSRHAGAIEWLRRRFPDISNGAEILATAGPDDVRGRIIIGNVPLQLAALADEVWAIEFAGAPPRGAEYGVDDMERAQARVHRYRVTDCGDAEGS